MDVCGVRVMVVLDVVATVHRDSNPRPALAGLPGPLLGHANLGGAHAQSSSLEAFTSRSGGGMAELAGGGSKTGMRAISVAEL